MRAANLKTSAERLLLLLLARPSKRSQVKYFHLKLKLELELKLKLEVERKLKLRPRPSKLASQRGKRARKRKRQRQQRQQVPVALPANSPLTGRFIGAFIRHQGDSIYVKARHSIALNWIELSSDELNWTYGWTKLDSPPSELGLHLAGPTTCWNGLPRGGRGICSPGPPNLLMDGRARRPLRPTCLRLLAGGESGRAAERPPERPRRRLIGATSAPATAHYRRAARLSC